MKAKNEWNEKDFNAVNSAILNYFSGKVFKNHRGETVIPSGIFENLENLLGLPYTSSSSYAMYTLDCNVHLFHPKETGFKYDHVFITESGNVILVLMDSEEKEMTIQLT
jgi:hypothetical protein